jgi:hypothetical protein
MNTIYSDRRRWFRFGLRSLMIALTVLCVWLGLKVNAARRQHAAVQAILQAGGEVSYDYQIVPITLPGYTEDYNIDRKAVSSVPSWLRSVFGDDFFRNVTDVGFYHNIPAGFDLNRLIDLPTIRGVAIRANPAAEINVPLRPIRDAELAVFGRLSRLHQLRLFGQEVEGPGMQSLVGLSHLRQLGLYGTIINDEGLKQIGKLTTLQNIMLTADRISDAGLQYLSTIPKLNLDLMGPSVAQISDSRLAALGRLDNLDVLSFHKCHFIDENSLKRLHNMAQLKGLNFFECDITDTALQNLHGFTNLLNVHIEKSHATAQGIRELQKSLPNTTVVGP